MGKDDSINNTFHIAGQDWFSSERRKTGAGEVTFFVRCGGHADCWRIMSK